MPSRREFIRGTAAASLFSKTVLGANDRINYAFIGLGARTELLEAAFFKQQDGNLAAICDCWKAKIDFYQERLKKKFESFIDYRRLMERKDIDAVVIATPDHLHEPIMAAALETGKDVYVEKPCAHSVDSAARMLKAYRSHKQIVQLGTQQRSWDHFQEACRIVREGGIGNVNYVVVGMGTISGGRGMGAGAARTSSPSAPVPIPEGLNWDLFLGPAKKVPFDPARLNWRGYWDYSGGGMSDMGTHWMDMMTLAMGVDTIGPSFVSTVSTRSDDPERIPGTFISDFEYPTFFMTQTSFAPPTAEPIVGGPTFYGSRGFLRVNRSGYIIRRYAAGAAPRGAAEVPGMLGRPRYPGVTMPSQAPPGGRAQQAAPAAPLEEKSYVLTSEDNIAHERGSEVVHVRAFFDSIKSRKKGVSEFEVGFHSTLPCLLTRESVRQRRALIWDESTLSTRPA